ncbi:MAG TPA: alpha/beta hydrolase family protein [Polyangiaceae bacterium]|nr:alpha/beta hydrolase family protein [Polyangiaceae bacterium]
MPRTLALSPSVCHAPLLEQTPRLSYAGGPVGPWQRKLRRELAGLLGLDGFPTRRPPLAARTLWQRRHALGTIAKVVFLCEPGAHAVAYVCIPSGSRPPHRFMICLQGHTSGAHNSIGLAANEKRRIAVEGDRDFAVACMRHGVAALALEQRAFGERSERVQRRRSIHNGCEDAAMRALMLGRTLLGERVYDVDRAIDYLESRGDADLSCVGVMGNSGGGTVSIYAAALLSRVGFAMPSSSLCTFRDSIMTIHHCADNYVPGLYGLADMGDVLGLAAPKPVVVVGSNNDPIFPYRGLRRAYGRVRQIYRAARAEDRLRLFVGREGHRFYAEPAFRLALPLFQASLT